MAGEQARCKDWRPVAVHGRGRVCGRHLAKQGWTPRCLCHLKYCKLRSWCCRHVGGSGVFFVFYQLFCLSDLSFSKHLNSIGEVVKQDIKFEYWVNKLYFKTLDYIFRKFLASSLMLITRISLAKITGQLNHSDKYFFFSLTSKICYVYDLPETSSNPGI